MPNALQNFAGFLADPESRREIKNGLLDAINRGMVGGLLGGPVDVATMALRPLGYKVEKPVGGSEWWGDKMQAAGMVSPNRNALAEMSASLMSPGAVVDTARTARGLLGVVGGAMGASADTGAMRAAIDIGALKAKFPGVDFWLNQRGDIATLDRVVVPKEMRGQGVGSKFMTELVKAADADGARLGLTPSSDLGGNKARLTEFYKRYGFVPNKGKNRDFELMQGMVRQPEQ